VTASSAPVNNREASKTIDGSGISSPTAIETFDPVPPTWPSHNTSNTSGWLSDDSVSVDSHWIEFDLGTAYKLSEVHIWNWNNNGGGTQTNDGIKDVNVLFSIDGVNFGGLQTFAFTQAPNGTPYTGQDIALSEVSAQWVRFDIQSTFEHASTQVGRAALAEVRFTGIIPEPTTAIMLALSSMFVFRRRR
jgi:hypothetical protein